MELTVKETKDPNKFYVGLKDHTKVFIPPGSQEESDMRLYLVYVADNADSALHQATLDLLSRKYEIMHDPLWAWR